MFFSPDAFKMSPNEELVVSCHFGAGGQSPHPAVDVEVGDLRWAGSDSVAAPVPRLQNWWFVKVWQTCEG